MDITLNPEIWQVTTNELNFRTSAQISDNNIIRTLFGGERVIVLAIAGNDENWRYIRTMTDNRHGYVHKDYIQYVSEVPVNPDDLDTRVTNLENLVEEIDGILSVLNNSVIELESRVRALEGDKGGNGPVEPPNVSRSLSDGFNEMNLNIITPKTPIQYRLSIGFTTHNGSFEYDKPGTVFHVSKENRDRILLSWGNTHVYLGAGADNHIHVGLVDSNGNIIRPLDKDVRVKIWWDGHPEKDGTWKILNHKNGFENFPMGDKKYNPSNGEHGIYKIVLVNSEGQHISEEVHGMGLPFGWHVSPFLLFQET